MHVNFDPTAPAAPLISFDDFLKVDIRVGRVISAEVYEKARNPSYKLLIDFGDVIGQKKSAAQITAHYSPENLLGKEVLAVVNFPPRQIGKFMSEVLVLGISDLKEQVVLFNLDKKVPLGARLH